MAGGGSEGAGAPRPRTSVQPARLTYAATLTRCDASRITTSKPLLNAAITSWDRDASASGVVVAEEVSGERTGDCRSGNAAASALSLRLPSR